MLLHRLAGSPRPFCPPGQVRQQCFIFSQHLAYFHLQTTWAWFLDSPNINHIATQPHEEKRGSLICRWSPPDTERLNDLPWSPTETQQGAEKKRAPNFFSPGLYSATSNNLIAGTTALLWRGSTPAAPLITAWRSMLISTSPWAPAQHEEGRREKCPDPY